MVAQEKHSLIKQIDYAGIQKAIRSVDTKNPVHLSVETDVKQTFGRLGSNLSVKTDRLGGLGYNVNSKCWPQRAAPNAKGAPYQKSVFAPSTCLGCRDFRSTVVET